MNNFLFLSWLAVVQAAVVSSGACPEFNHHVRFAPNMRKKLQEIKTDCGQICDTNVASTGKGKYYDFIEKKVDCRSLFESLALDQTLMEDTLEGEEYTPPKFCELSRFLRNQFTYNQRVKENLFYLNDYSATTRSLNWTREVIEDLRQLDRDRNLMGGYGKETTDEIRRFLSDHLPQDLTGTHFLVIGSESAWIEAILLNLGVSMVTTLDYNPIYSSHPQIRAMNLDALKKQVMEGQIGGNGLMFDAVVTFSSLEHSGLGRYGDPINPWADLIAMARSWCITKPGGKMFIGVPTGPDEIYFNAHRVYGPIQYPHLFANWKVIYTEAKIDGSRKVHEEFKYYQPMHVLEKNSEKPGFGHSDL